MARKGSNSRSALKRKIWQRDRYLCRYCGTNVQARVPFQANTATVDHVVPLAKGGTNGRDNLVTACLACNNGKGDMTLAEWERAGKPKLETGDD